MEALNASIFKQKKNVEELLEEFQEVYLKKIAGRVLGGEFYKKLLEEFFITFESIIEKKSRNHFKTIPEEFPTKLLREFPQPLLEEFIEEILEVVRKNFWNNSRYNF